jgi:hypothetical protein
MAVTVQGDWKVKVTIKNAAFDQRSEPRQGTLNAESGCQE